MIFSTINQLNCLLILFFYGSFWGIISAVISVVFLKKYQKNIIKTIFLSLFCSIFHIFFIFLLNFYNCGNFSISLYFSYLFGFFTIKQLLRKSVVFFQTLWYNTIKKTFLKNKKAQKKSNEISSES